MNLSQLKHAVDVAVQRADEFGVFPGEIPVSLQIDCGGKESIYTDEQIELHYDNNCQASGCVLLGYIP